MAKDPAFLFYSSDFLTGTLYMTNEQIGIYIKLLCSQHQHGGLIDKIIFNSIVNNNEIIRTKFIETELGFYNERLAIEMEKRNKKSTNLSEAAKDVWEKRKNAIALQLHTKNNTIVQKTYTKNMQIENENENENVYENIVKKEEIENFKIDEKLIFPNAENLEIELPTNEIFNCKVLISNLTIPKVFAKDEDVRGLWTVFKAIRFNGQNQYYGWNKVYEHFKNDIKSQIQTKKIYKDGKTVNGNNEQTKLGTSDARLKALKEW